MKYTWEPTDIRAGRYVACSSDTDTVTHQASTTYKIGYVYFDNSVHSQLVLVAVSDGQTRLFDSRAALCQVLNDRGYRPVYNSELVRVVEHLAAMNEGRHQ